MKDFIERQTGFIPWEFRVECQKFDLPCEENFTFVFLEKLSYQNALKIKHQGETKLVPSFLLPYAVEVEARRQDEKRKSDRQKALKNQQREIFQRQVNRSELLRTLQEKHPEIFP